MVFRLIFEFIDKNLVSPLWSDAIIKSLFPLKLCKNLIPEDSFISDYLIKSNPWWVFTRV